MALLDESSAGEAVDMADIAVANSLAILPYC